MDNAPNGSSELPPATYDENDDIVLSMENNIDAEEPQAPPAASRLRRARQKAPESEQRRTQNRNAAARHRQRQQQRMSELVRKESMLKQRVSELEIEVEMLRRGRAGLKLPERDPFTASILDMLEDVSNLRASLLRYTVESQLLVEDVSWSVHLFWCRSLLLRI
ncbi:hypothetical protein GGI06_005574 [Coemansia sp. S85]|nr:hypothetical protein GGI06_005574 [Coemansia sp. S85]